MPNAAVCIQSPIGFLKLEATDDTLTAVRFINPTKVQKNAKYNDILQQTERQLAEYFEGNRSIFELPLKLNGTAFEQEVWEELHTIPFGSTITYKQLAVRLGDSNKVRAVGRANGQNSIPIIVPCHRVIGANNKLTGYAGGIERKQWLLKHEGALLI